MLFNQFFIRNNIFNVSLGGFDNAFQQSFCVNMSLNAKVFNEIKLVERAGEN
jgi:hypothetical protein